MVNLTNEAYNRYVKEYGKAKKRIKRDRQILKITSKMIRTKALCPHDEKRLKALLKKKVQ